MVPGAGGQGTLCYNLMKFVERRWGGDKGPVQALWKELCADWERFVEHPYWLVEQMLGRRDLPRP